MADISTVGEIVNFLAIATYNRPMTKLLNRRVYQTTQSKKPNNTTAISSDFGVTAILKTAPPLWNG